MAGPKSTQTYKINLITSIIHPYAFFLSSFYDMDMGHRNKLTSNVIINTD